MPPRSSSRSPRGRTRDRSAGAPRKSLLIIHLDADQLRRDTLHLGDHSQVTALIAEHGLGAEVTVVDATDRADLHRVLAELVGAGRTFHVVAAIAHSNARGIKIASDRDAFVDWSAFAAYLAPLAPRRLVLIACQAGQWPAAAALFKRLKSLRRIYASPVNASKQLATLMLLLVPHVVEVKVPKQKHLLATQAAAVAFTGRQLRMWERKDVSNPEGRVLDFLARYFDQAAQEVPNLVRRLFG